MIEKDFLKASAEDRAKYVLRPYDDLPLTKLVEGSESHLVTTKKMTISFLTMHADSVFELHSHDHEQCMIVLDGYCDELIGTKMYRVQKGDVIFLPAKIPHGAFIREVDCKVIDIFVPRRDDYACKMHMQHPSYPIKFDDTI